jgi:hypothetical protein
LADSIIPDINFLGIRESSDQEFTTRVEIKRNNWSLQHDIINHIARDDVPDFNSAIQSRRNDLSIIFGEADIHDSISVANEASTFIERVLVIDFDLEVFKDNAEQIGSL